MFLSHTLDGNGLDAFEHKCHVHQLRESDELPTSLSEPHHFFYRRMYNPMEQTFTIAKGSEPVKVLKHVPKILIDAYHLHLVPAGSSDGAASARCTVAGSAGRLAALLLAAARASR